MGVSDTTTAQPKTKVASCPKHGNFESKAFSLPSLCGKPPRVIWSSCPSCSREENEREEASRRSADEEARQQRIESKLSRAGIPKRFRDRSFESYEADTEPKKHALNVAREFAENFKEHARIGSTLVFAGSVGTGKVHLATSIAKHIMLQGHSAFFATAREILMMLRAKWDDKNAPSELEVLRMLSSVSLLIIDEIGIQFNTDAERDQLFGVIDGRYRDMMPTIFTTNQGPRELLRSIGERSYSRLREEGKWVPFDWEDYRRKSKQRTA